MTRAEQGRNTAGFTLVELLVVIAVIAMLVSMLLPAIQAAREAGRRIQCVNHIRQLALAVNNFESANTRLPPGGMVALNRRPTWLDAHFDPKKGKMFSWIVLVLPFMDEEALFDQFNLETNAFNQRANPAEFQPATLLCPSDSSQGRAFQHPTLSRGKRLAKGNYAAYVSPMHIDLQLVFPGALAVSNPGRSLGFEPEHGQLISDVRDGLSKTFMISEVRTRQDDRDQRGVWALPWAGASLLSHDIHHDFEAPGIIYSPFVPGAIAAQTPNSQGPNVDMLYDCPQQAAAQLDRMPCATYLDDEEQHYLSAAPRSLHPGGVNVALLDSHVIFVTNGIDPVTMSYLVSINDGQAVDPPRK